MCGAFQQEDNNKLDREAANRMKDADPKNVLDIIGNFNKKNSALDQIMEQENF